MKKYKIGSHLAELVSPIIKKTSTNFSLGDKYVKVYVDLFCDEIIYPNVFVGEMDNTNSWNDDDVSSFAENALENFKID